tara:strand:- start:124 stop:807 length:684 start_codon:yes stop_codon:yes gene_type:complete
MLFSIEDVETRDKVARTGDGMATTAKDWQPSKPADEYSIDEIKALDFFKAAQMLYTEEAEQVSEAREAIRRRWMAVRDAKVLEHVAAIFELRGGGEKQLVITPSGVVEGAAAPAKAARRRGTRTRWRDDQWEAQIGETFAHEGDKGTFTLMVEKVEDSDAKKGYRLVLVEPDGCERVYPGDPADDKPKGGKKRKGRYHYEKWTEMHKASTLPGLPKRNLPTMFNVPG